MNVNIKYKKIDVKTIQTIFKDGWANPDNQM